VAGNPAKIEIAGSGETLEADLVSILFNFFFVNDDRPVEYKLIGGCSEMETQQILKTKNNLRYFCAIGFFNEFDTFKSS
jgi:hypothetical protein